MAQQQNPQQPPDYRVFNQELLELIHPTINWENDDDPHEKNPGKNPTANNEDVE